MKFGLWLVGPIERINFSFLCQHFDLSSPVQGSRHDEVFAGGLGCFEQVPNSCAAISQKKIHTSSGNSKHAEKEEIKEGENYKEQIQESLASLDLPNHEGFELPGLLNQYSDLESGTRSSSK